MISFDVIMVSVKKNYFMTMIYETWNESFPAFWIKF